MRKNVKQTYARQPGFVRTDGGRLRHRIKDQLAIEIGERKEERTDYKSWLLVRQRCSGRGLDSVSERSFRVNIK